MRLQDKVAIITGSGSGIGRATALLFAREGATVMSMDIIGETAEATARDIKDAGGKADYVQGDVAIDADVERMVKTTVERFGRVDILVNNAGILAVMRIPQVSEDVWDRIIDVNLKGVFLGCKHVIPQMMEQGGGAIVNVSSVAGVRGEANFSAYSASKGGVALITRTLAVEYARFNIRVNCVCPGLIKTPMFDRQLALIGDQEKALERMKRTIPRRQIGEADEVARGILFLASDEASLVMGAALPMDGGVWAGDPPW